MFEEKAADAVDYADIDEALDEEEEKEDPLARFQSLLPISTAMDIDEDDYDAPEPTKTTGETGEPLKGTFSHNGLVQNVNLTHIALMFILLYFRHSC